MKLNVVEKALMNNRVRALIQWRYESALMERLGGRVEGARVLEIGCGNGVGTEIIFERFRAREVHAFDIDPDMVNQARRRLSRFPSERLRLSVGNAVAIEAEDSSYDAVFDFGIIHHVREWQRVISEVARVIKPGGRFFFEEATSKALNRWSIRTFTDHPKENRFSAKEFVGQVEGQGLTVGTNYVEWLFGDFFTGVGQQRMCEP